MFRLATIAFVVGLAVTPTSSPASDPARTFTHGSLSQHFVVVDGAIDWAPPSDAPPITVMAHDFWRILEAVMPIGATLETFPLTVQGGEAIQLRVPHVLTRTVVCDAPLPLTDAAARVLKALGCVPRTEAENQQLLDAARKEIDLHRLTLTPGIKL